MIAWLARKSASTFTEMESCADIFLAHRGCITSAESVLVSMQSHEEVYRVLAERPVRLLRWSTAPLQSLTLLLIQELVPILSVSPQSIASLAALHELSLAETMRGLRLFFKQYLGFRYALIPSR